VKRLVTILRTWNDLAMYHGDSARLRSESRPIQFQANARGRAPGRPFQYGIMDPRRSTETTDEKVR
jgi:hypothetical protein